MGSLALSPFSVLIILLLCLSFKKEQIAGVSRKEEIVKWWIHNATSNGINPKTTRTRAQRSFRIFGKIKNWYLTSKAKHYHEWRQTWRIRWNFFLKIRNLRILFLYKTIDKKNMRSNSHETCDDMWLWELFTYLQHWKVSQNLIIVLHDDRYQTLTKEDRNSINFKDESLDEWFMCVLYYMHACIWNGGSVKICFWGNVLKTHWTDG